MDTPTIAELIDPEVRKHTQAALRAISEARKRRAHYLRGPLAARSSKPKHWGASLGRMDRARGFFSREASTASEGPGSKQRGSAD